MHYAYSFALGFDDNLVSSILDRLNVSEGNLVLDPFCGTGTTLIECKRRGVRSVGIDANPVCVLIARAKLDWRVSRRDSEACLEEIMRRFRRRYSTYMNQFKSHRTQGKYYSPLAHPFFSSSASGRYLIQSGMLKRGWISPRPALKCLLLTDIIQKYVPQGRIRRFFLLSLLGLLVPDISNMSYGPEIYRARRRHDVDVLDLFIKRTQQNLEELSMIRKSQEISCSSRVHLGDSVNGALDRMTDNSVDFVITSPPYPCEHDYTRMTRLELVFSGYITDKHALRSLKKNLLRCCTRNIYTGDSLTQDVIRFPGIRELIHHLDAKAKGYSHGFARLYSKVVGEYFGGMLHHFRHIARVLRPGARCAYVVGDQASFFSVQIKTAELLSRLAQSKNCGLKIVDIVELRSLRGTTGKRRNNFERLLIMEK